MVGPLVAGVAIALTSFKGAFIVDAATYAIGLAALPLVTLRPRATSDEDVETSVLDGFRRIGRTPVLRRTVACTTLVHLLYGAALLIEPADDVDCWSIAI